MNTTEVYSTLISANHILHYNKVLDAYGHVSVRHPSNPDVFIMANCLASALVSCPSDLVEYNVADSAPVDSTAKIGYQERFIHGELYKRFPEINSVIHSHSEAVLPYTMNGVPMKPAFHIAGFLGTHVPNWDIVGLYEPGDQQDMLVNNERLGASLASVFSSALVPDSASDSSLNLSATSLPSLPDFNVVLMTNHGFTTIGSSIEQAVYRAVYTQVNATVQTNAIIMRNAFFNEEEGASDGPGLLGIRYLDEEQTSGTIKMNDASQDRPWRLWLREVEACPLYVNIR